MGPTMLTQRSTRMSRASWFGSAVRFAAVGLSNAAISYAMLRIGLSLPSRIPYRAGGSQLVAYAIGIGWSYYWNRRWTFRSNEPVRQGLFRFASLQVGIALASSAAISLLVDVRGFPPTPSWLAVVTGATLTNFVLSRLWIFRRPLDSGTEPR
jgi:putative flippase GtrA